MLSRSENFKKNSFAIELAVVEKCGMPQTPTNPSGLELRAPRVEEQERAAYLFRNVGIPAQAFVLVAVRSRPVERFVAGVAWWMEGDIARFRLQFPPGVALPDAGVALIGRAEEGARAAGAKMFYYADLVPGSSELCELLQGQGVERLRSERFFEVSAQAARQRVNEAYKKHRAEIPANWRTDCIRHHPPEIVFNLVLAHRLLPPAELTKYWRATTRLGFDLDMSCILFDGNRAFGTLLARRMGEVLFYEVRVVHEANPRLRALGNLCLFYHDTQEAPPEEPIFWLQFRGGETEHRETANLAFRMGGRELPVRHLFVKKL